MGSGRKVKKSVTPAQDDVDPMLKMARELGPEQRAVMRAMYKDRFQRNMKMAIPEAQRECDEASERVEEAEANLREAQRALASAELRLSERERIARHAERLVLEIDAMDEDGE